MPYLLDSDVFIQAKNLHYGLDFCPAFWDWLDAAHAAGSVFSIEKVEGELKAIEDDLSEWVSDRPGMFLPPDNAVIASLQAVSLWTSQPATVERYTPSAISTFLQVADYYLVAQAHAWSYVVVTHERADHAIKRIKIPNVCIGLGIKCMTPFEMLRPERARFVLGADT